VRPAAVCGKWTKNSFIASTFLFGLKMTITWYDSFVGNDWARYANVLGKVSCVTAVAVSIISFIFGFAILSAIWTLFTALILAIWEFPFVYFCIPNIQRFKDFLNEKAYLKFEEARAVLLILLSTYCFVSVSPCIAAGLLYIFNAVILIFAAINRREDAADSLTTDDETPYVPSIIPKVQLFAATPTTYSTLAQAPSNKFGTF
jgi:hypothetical protein